jgi:hypothetical protein
LQNLVIHNLSAVEIRSAPIIVKIGWPRRKLWRTRVQDPPPDANAENLSVGGLGVLLVGQFCPSKRYERRDEQSVIELFVSSDVPLAR